MNGPGPCTQRKIEWTEQKPVYSTGDSDFLGLLPKPSTSLHRIAKSDHQCSSAYCQATENTSCYTLDLDHLFWDAGPLSSIPVGCWMNGPPHTLGVYSVRCATHRAHGLVPCSCKNSLLPGLDYYQGSTSHIRWAQNSNKLSLHKMRGSNRWALVWNKMVQKDPSSKRRYKVKLWRK